MNRPVPGQGPLETLMLDLGRDARVACRAVALAPAAVKKAGLEAAASQIEAAQDEILAANAEDVAAATAAGQAASFIDRLTLNPARVAAMVEGVRIVAGLVDPVGAVTESWSRPNGLRIERVRTPLGVIGIIFESRPNVAADAASLALMAGNAAILRSGQDAFRTVRAIHAAFVTGLREAGLPEGAVQLVPTRDRAAVGAMLAGLDGAIDVIVPRGGRGLVERVQREARVPVFAHLEGVNHVYVHASADLAMATRLVVNAKMRRTGVCGAAETLLIDRARPEFVAPLVGALSEAGCEVRGDAAIRALVPPVLPVLEGDFGREFLDAIIAVKLVDGLDEAIDHIARFGSQHTDAIVASDEAAAARFLAEVDSAIVLHNASTQFADGGEFGFGAEIGIATGRLHARGPVGVEQLTTFKYRVHGTGQIRP